MPRKRVPLNISLPNLEFKERIEQYHKEKGGTPSEVVVTRYKRLFKKK